MEKNHKHTLHPKDFISIEDEMRHDEFRVVIFGSARIKEGDEAYEEVFKIAKAVGEMDDDIVTGGGPGLMQAASKGHVAGSTKNDSHSIGINIKLPFEQKPNKHLDIIVEHARFSTRLDQFMTLSNVIVVAPGGIGTTLELFYSWQLMQVGHTCKIPIILLGDMWHSLLQWVRDWPLKKKLMSPEDMDGIICVDTAQEAIEAIKRAKKAYEDRLDDSYVNWKKYKLHPNKKTE